MVAEVSEKWGNSLTQQRRQTRHGNKKTMTSLSSLNFLCCLLFCFLQQQTKTQAQPTITLPANLTVTSPREYFLVHTSNATTGSPTGVATMLSALPIGWPLPSTTSTSTISTSSFSVGISTSTSITNFIFSITSTTASTSDFYFDGTLASTTRNLLTRFDLWARYGYGIRRWNATLNVRDSGGWTNVTFTLYTHPTYTWYDSAGTTWRQDRLPRLAVNGGITGWNTGISGCNILQAIPSSYNPTALFGPIVSCSATGQTLRTNNNYATATSNQIFLTWTDNDANTNGLPVGVKVSNLTVSTTHGSTTSLPYFNTSVVNVGGGTVNTGTFALTVASMMNAGIYFGPYTVTVRMTNAYGVSASIILYLSMTPGRISTPNAGGFTGKNVDLYSSYYQSGGGTGWYLNTPPTLGGTVWRGSTTTATTILATTFYIAETVPTNLGKDRLLASNSLGGANASFLVSDGGNTPCNRLGTGARYARLTPISALNTTVFFATNNATAATVTNFAGYPVPTFGLVIVSGTQSPWTATFNVNGGVVDYETFSQWKFRVALFDECYGSYGDYPTPMTISVVDVNEPPALTTLAKSTPLFRVYENATRGFPVTESLLLSKYVVDPDLRQRLILSILNTTTPVPLINGTNATTNETILISDPNFDQSSNDNGFSVDACGGELSVDTLAGALWYGLSPNYTLTLSTCDTGFLCVYWSIVIEILEANREPIATPNTALEIPENSPAGSIVINTNGDVLATDQNTPRAPLEWRTLTYSLSNNLDIFTVNNVTGAISIVPGGTSDLDFEGPTPSFELYMKVQDQGGLFNYFSVVVTVTDVNEAPVFSSTTLTQVVSINEWTPLAPLSTGDFVGLPVSAFDYDAGDTPLLVYNLTDTSGYFLINATTGQIYLTARGAGVNVLDFESAAKSYNVTVRVTDPGNLTTFANITIFVADVNEVPVANNVTFTIVEFPGAFDNMNVGDLNGTDPEGTLNNILTYTINGTDVAAFKLDAGASKLKVLNSSLLDFEAKPIMRLTYTVTDSGKPGSAANALTSPPGFIIVNLINVNEAPAFTNRTCTISMVENSPVGNWIGRLYAVDPDVGQTSKISYSFVTSSLAITQNPRAGSIASFVTVPILINNASGALTTDYLFDYESTIAVSVQARATDWIDTSLFSSLTCTLNIIDVNEAPYFSQTSYTKKVTKNAALGYSVGRVSALDFDFNDIVSYSVNADSSAISKSEFTINNITGDITTLIAHDVSQLSTSASFILRVRATDSGGLFAVVDVTISVTDVNSAPYFYSSVYTRSIPERASINTALTGGAVTGTDNDAGDVSTLVYSIIPGAGSSFFSINPSNGIITTAGTIDFETTSSYSLTVQITDQLSGQGTATVNINVLDVNEAPVWSRFALAIDENSATGTWTIPSTVLATDPDTADQNKLHYILWTTGTPFSVNTSGGVFVSSASLNFEFKNSYALLVGAMDSGWDGLGNITTNQTVTITINNRNDAPVEVDRQINAAENLPRSSLLATAAATDEDSGQTMAYVFSRTDKFCWFTDFSTLVSGNPVWTANASIEIPVPPLAPTASSNLDVIFRAKSSSSVSLLAIETPPPYSGTIRWFEYRFGTTASNTFARRCSGTSAAFSCTTVTSISGASSSKTLMRGSSLWAHLYVTIMSNGTHSVGSRSGNEISSTWQEEYSFTDATFIPQYFYVRTADATGTSRLSSVCFTPNASSIANVDAYNSSSAMAIGATNAAISSSDIPFNFEITKWVGLEVRATDVQAGPSYLEPQNLYDYGVVLLQVQDVNEAPYFNLQMCSPISTTLYIDCLSVPENSLANVFVNNFIAALDPDTPLTSFATLMYTLSTSGNVVGTRRAFNIAGTQITVASPAPNLDFESQPTFSLTVTVTDGGGLTSSGTLRIDLSDVNEVPTIFPASLSIEENTFYGTSIGSSIQCTDPDTVGSLNAALVFDMPWQATPGKFMIDSNGQVRVAGALDFEFQTSYVVTIRCTDRNGGSGSLSSSANYTINILNVNEPPVIDDQERSIYENATAGQAAGTALAASDPDFGATLTFVVSGGNGSSIFRINRCLGILELIPGKYLDFETAQVYQVEVTVYDEGVPSLYDTAWMTIHIMDADDAPTVSDQSRSVNENSIAGAIVGSPISYYDVDVYGGVVPWYTVAFDIIGGNDRGIFAVNSSTGQISIVSGGPVLLNFEDATANRYTLLVRLRDQGNMASTAYVTINIADINEVPEWSDPSGNNFVRSVDENCPRSPRVANEKIGTPITIFDQDAGQTPMLVTNILSGDSLGYFGLDTSVSGKVSVIVSSLGATSLDFETTAVYILLLRTTDNGSPTLWTDKNITINIINRNEAPWFVNPPFVRNVTENATVTTRVGSVIPALDPEDSILRFSITSGNVGNVFGIDSSTGAIFIADTAALDFETVPRYTLGLLVQDQGTPEGTSSSLSVTSSVTVFVTDVNEVPFFTGSLTLSVPENSPRLTVAGIIGAMDQDTADQGRLQLAIVSQDSTGFGRLPFIIDNTGTLSVSNDTLLPDLDFETRPSFNLVLSASDSGWDGSGIKTRTTPVLVQLTNVNEAPFFSETTYNLMVPRLAKFGSVIGWIRARDVDIPDTLTWSWTPSLSYITYNNTELFKLNSTTGSITCQKPAGWSLITNDVFNMSVTVTDLGGLSVTTLVNFKVTDATDPPLLYDQTRSINENSLVDTKVGDVISATAPDANTVYAWTIVGNNVGNAFRIESTTGQIRVNSSSLNFEFMPQYQLLVQAQDVTSGSTGGLTAQCSVFINLLDVNEAPSMPTSTSFSVFENSVLNTQVGIIVGTDPDAYDQPLGRLLYSMVTTGTPFNVNATTGALFVSNPVLDFESKSTYTFTVRVTDSGWDGMGDYKSDGSVTVVITNRNDPPVLSDATGSVFENSPSSLVRSVIAQDQDANQNINYTFTRPNAVCWYRAITTINTNSLIPISLPPSPDAVTITFRVMSSGSIKIVLEVLTNQDRYEFSISQTIVSVVRCNSLSCGAPIGGTTSAALLSATSLSNLYVSVDRSSGALEVGTRAGIYEFAAQTPILTRVDPAAPPALNVSFLNVQGSTLDTYFTSLCFNHATASINASALVDGMNGVVTTNSGVNGGSFNFEAQQQYGIEVRATDVPNGLLPERLSDYSVLIIDVRDANEVPYFNYIPCANASYVSCLSIAENTPVGTIAGTLAAGVDPDFLAIPLQTLSYALKANNNQVGTSSVFNIGASSRVVTLNQAVLNFEQRPTFELTASVTDNGVPSLSSDGIFLVQLVDVDEQPIIFDQTVAVEENSANGTFVGAPIVATDPDTASTLFATLSYNITGGSGAFLFAIDSATGQMSVKMNQLDFETRNKWAVVVRVTDGGGLWKEAAITINIIDVNEVPVLLPQERSISEDAAPPAPAGNGLYAYDQDFGQALSFSIIGGNGSDIFRINRCAGIIELKVGYKLDFESNYLYTLQVNVVDDGWPPLAANNTMLVRILDANDAPVIDDQSRSVVENSPAGTIVGSALPWFDPDVFGGNVPWFTLRWEIMSGNDRGVFAINATSGQLYIAKGGPSLLNYEDSNSNFYTLLIRATDGGSPGLSDTATVVVTVTDVNEAPFFTDTTMSRAIDEDCPRSVRSVNENVGSRILASDFDFFQADNLTFSISNGNTQGYFWIVTSGANAGQLRLTASGATGLDFETQNNYTLSITITDNGLLPSIGAVTPLATTADVKIWISNRNEQPIFLPQSRSVFENATILTSVGDVLVATDPEESVGAGLKFKITAGNTLGIFGMDTLSGQIFIANNQNLDFESQNVFSLTVEVADSGFPDGPGAVWVNSNTITVNILDVNEAPRLTGTSFSMLENRPLGFSVGSILSLYSDPDFVDYPFFMIFSQPSTAGLVVSTTPFVINSTTGVISVGGVNGSTTQASDLDFETRSTYSLVVHVADKGGLRAAATVVISLTNVNEPPVFLPLPLMYARSQEVQDVGRALINFVSDQDTLVPATGEGFIFTFGIPSGNVFNIFTLSSSTGQISVVNSSALLFPLGMLQGPQYNLTVTVTDLGINGAQMSSTIVVTVQTVDNNFPPTVPSYSFIVSENSPLSFEIGRIFGSDRNAAEGQIVTYSLSAAGININRPFPFDVSTIASIGNGNVGVGRLFVKLDPVVGTLPLWSNLDFEAPTKAPLNGGVGFNVYTMTVTATDSHVTHLMGSGSVTIFVQDVPEDPYFAPSRVSKSGFFTLSVPENSPASTVIVLDPATSSNAGGSGAAAGGILARDDDAADAVANALVYSWKTTGVPAAQIAAAPLFAIDSATGVITVSALGAVPGTLDFETQRNYTLTALVTDTTGRTDEAIVTIVLLDVNEPAFFVNTGIRNTSGTFLPSFILSEATSANTIIGFAVASDVDAGTAGQLLYSLDLNDESAPFVIDPNTGRITLSTRVDFEDKSIYMPSVIVTDRSLSPLSVNLIVPVYIVDVSDSSISGIRLADGEELAEHGVTIGSGTDYDISHASMAVVVQTAGSTGVVITGTNMGFTSRKLTETSTVAAATQIIATYGPSATEYTATNCKVLIANTAILCFTAPGVGVSHAWKLNITTPFLYSTANFALSTPLGTGYMRPNITAVYLSSAAATPFDTLANAMPTAGGTDIVLEGRDFGPVGSQLTLIYGPTGVEFQSPSCTYLTAHYKVVCKSSQGVGRDLKFRLQVGVSGIQRSILFTNTAVRYNTPRIDSVSAPIMDTRGGQTVFIYGADLGPVGTSPVRGTYSWYNSVTDVRVAASPIYVAFNCVILPAFPHTGAQCTSVAGIGNAHRWTIEVGAQVSPPSPLNATTSYFIPKITRLGGQGADLALTPGGQPVIITGDQFGPTTPADANGNILDTFVAPLARYGHVGATTLQSQLSFSGVNCRVTVAHIQITCYTNEGTGKDLFWGVAVADQESGIFGNMTTNYAPPVVAFYSGDGSLHARTSGLQEVFISGKNMGPLNSPVDLVTYGPNATEFIGLSCAVSTPHLELRCLTNVGAGKGLTWFVVIDGQGSVFPTTDYAAPEVTGLAGPGATDASMDGGDIIRIIGTNFATQMHLQSVTYGPQGTEYDALNCSVTVSHSEITCVTVPGIGRLLRWVVTVGGQMSTPSAVTSSYGVPTIATIAPVHGPTEGDYIIRIDGKNLGLTVPGVRPVIHIETGSGSTSRPSASDITDYWTAVRLGQSVTNAVSLWIAELASPKLEIQDVNGRDSQTITFRMPEGYGKSRAIFVSVAGVPSDISTFVYDAPFITNVAPDRIGVPLGFLRVFIDGASFCASSNCGRILFDKVPQVAVNWSHTQILVISPDPSTTSSYVPVQVEVDGVLSNLATFSRPEPSFDALTGQGNWVDMNTRGGDPFYIAGVASISTIAAVDLGVLIGGRPCTGLTKSVDQDLSANYGLTPDSPLAEQYRTYRIDCLTPPGVGKTLPIIITVPGGQSRADAVFRFTYRPPTISDVQDGADFTPFLWSYLSPVTVAGITANGVPTLGRQVRLRGSCFGSEARVINWPGVTVQIVLATTVYTVPAFNVTDTELYFNMPPGQGAGIDIRVNVAAQNSRDPYASTGTSQSATVIRYMSPSIDSIGPQGLTTLGGGVITILGSDFGTASYVDSLVRGLPLVSFTYRDGSIVPCALIPAYTPTVNHSRIDCVLPEGQGKDVPVQVEIAGQLSNVATYTYALPVITAITPINGPTSGATLSGERINMTLIGSDLGRPGSASIEFRPATSNEGAPTVIVPASAFYFHNHTYMSFPMPEGAGSLMFVVAVVSGQDSSQVPNTAPITFSYNPPNILSISRADKNPGDCDDILDDSLIINNTVIWRIRPAGCYKTRGGYPLLLSGESFTAYKPVVTLGDLKMDVTEYSHNRIVATVPGGYGDFNPIVVHVMGRDSTTNNITIFQYDPPVVTSLSPNVPDATGEEVSYRGYNFGLEETPINIIIGGQPCISPKWFNDQLMSCNSVPDVVGPKNLSIAVANRSAPFVWLAEEGMIILQCKRGWTGMVDEWCIECATDMRGAVCPGGELYYDKLVSQVGWWRANVTGDFKVNCHPLRQHRDTCPIFQPCEPAESCLGSNTCAEGYCDPVRDAGVKPPCAPRCSQCLPGKYYRVNGECIKCPDSPWAIVVVFILGAGFALTAAYFLNAKNVSLALISIGTDYFQIVAMFARTRIKWPALVKQLFLIMSAFNFNLEIVAPECAIPSVSFSGKWLFIEGLPIMGWCLLSFIHLCRYLYKRFFTTQRGAALHSHAPALVGTGIVVLRILYIYITRTTFDVFNCAPTNPPDGNEYMAWNLSIVCYEPGGTHLFLMPFAIFALCLYVLGAPIAAGVLMYRNRYAVKYDQILRAQGIGNDPLTNPSYFLFRQKWGKLYQHFIPEQYFWELIITSKKFLIAFVSLMFRQSPSYQLALALMTLFAAYVLHMRYLPYLTHFTSREVFREHKQKVSEGDPMHVRIATDMRESATKNLRKRTVTKFGWKSGFAHGGVPWTARRAQLNQALASKYPFVMGILDYNTVDAVLLCCAILVNLAGIMFDSARFTGDMAKYYQNEYDSLAYAAVVLLFGSIMYFLFVFGIDLYIVCAPEHADKCFASTATSLNAMAGKRIKKGLARFRKAIDSKDGGQGPSKDDGMHPTLHNNPLLAAGSMYRAYQAENVGGFSTDELDDMIEPPSLIVWPLLREGMKELQNKVVNFQKVTANMQQEMEEMRAALGRAPRRDLSSGLDADAIGGLGRVPRARNKFDAVSVGSKSKLPSKTDIILRLRDVRQRGGVPLPLNLHSPDSSSRRDDDENDDDEMGGGGSMGPRPAAGTRRGDYMWDDVLGKWVRAKSVAKMEEKKALDKKAGGWFSVPKVVTATGGMSWLKEVGSKKGNTTTNNLASSSSASAGGKNAASGGVTATTNPLVKSSGGSNAASSTGASKYSSTTPSTGIKSQSTVRSFAGAPTTASNASPSSSSGAKSTTNSPSSSSSSSSSGSSSAGKGWSLPTSVRAAANDAAQHVQPAEFNDVETQEFSVRSPMSVNRSGGASTRMTSTSPFAKSALERGAGTGAFASSRSVSSPITASSSSSASRRAEPIVVPTEYEDEAEDENNKNDDDDDAGSAYTAEEADDRR